MKIIELHYWKVETPDGGGMYSVEVGKFLTKELAEQVAVIKKGNYSWPYSVIEVHEYIEIMESIQEFESKVILSKIKNKRPEDLTPEELTYLMKLKTGDTK